MNSPPPGVDITRRCLLQVARLEKALEEGRDRLEALAADQLRLRVELSCVPDSHAATAAAAGPTRNTAAVAEDVPSSPLVSLPAAIAATVPLLPGADFLVVPPSTAACPIPLGECSSHVTTPRGVGAHPAAASSAGGGSVASHVPVTPDTNVTTVVREWGPPHTHTPDRP